MQLRPWILVAFLAMSVASIGAQAQFAHTQGKEIVDGAGKPLLLRGINLGNWFVARGLYVAPQRGWSGICTRD